MIDNSDEDLEDDGANADGPSPTPSLGQRFKDVMRQAGENGIDVVVELASCDVEGEGKVSGSEMRDFLTAGVGGLFSEAFTDQDLDDEDKAECVVQIFADLEHDITRLACSALVHHLLHFGEGITENESDRICNDC